MSTLIENISINNEVEKYEEKEKYKLDDNNLINIINNFNNSLKMRMDALERYYLLYGIETLEIVCNLSRSFQLSGTKLIEAFLLKICINSSLSTVFKLEALKGLYLYEEDEEYISEKDDIEEKQDKMDINENIKKRNNIRKLSCYNALNIICFEFTNETNIELPTPCKIESIHMLMTSEIHKTQSALYFSELINNQNIDCEFRYKTILSLKNKLKIAVVNIHTIKPLDTDTVLRYAKHSKMIFTVEEHQIAGGLGSAIAEFLAEKNPVKIGFIGVKDEFGQSGKPLELIEKYGLDVAGLKKQILEKIK